ncbi:MAG: HNH endonuclease [Acidimicrobiales bacterium]
MSDPKLRARFEAKVDRSGDHHLWTGSKLRDGSGKLKIGTRTVTARRVAWELKHGPLPTGAEVRACPDNKACVRVDHLSVRGGGLEARSPAGRGRRASGSGSMEEIRPGVWKFTVGVGRHPNGKPRREYRTIRADGEAEAARELAAFVAELNEAPPPETTDERDLTLDEAVDRYLGEHLTGEKGRQKRTIRDYRQIHDQWFSPEVGQRRLRDIDEATIDRIFGKMRAAGLSRARMSKARSLYHPLFRWARRRHIIRHSPMADFELPTSTQVPRPRTPPEIDQLCTYLNAALEVVPDIAPVLTLGATTGMRRGELVVIRRDQLAASRSELHVDSAADLDGVKLTKNRLERTMAIDEATVAMLLRHCVQMDERAAAVGVQVAPDGFVFSLEPDCSRPMPADYVTTRVQELKDYLGIPDKRPATIALENEALRLFREAPEQERRSGPRPRGRISYDEIGRRLGRSEKWAMLAVAAALRREAAAARRPIEHFDGSIPALRKFTSSELLDSGFNISAVAQRQGHGPKVLMEHYAQRRKSADRKAAEHLGRLVHGALPPADGFGGGPSL